MINTMMKQRAILTYKVSYNSWSMSTANATWIAPSAMPTDGGIYNWDEDNQTWINLSGASAGG